MMTVRMKVHVACRKLPFNDDGKLKFNDDCTYVGLYIYSPLRPDDKHLSDVTCIRIYMHTHTHTNTHIHSLTST